MDDTEVEVVKDNHEIESHVGQNDNMQSCQKQIEKDRDTCQIEHNPNNR